MTGTSQTDDEGRLRCWSGHKVHTDDGDWVKCCMMMKVDEPDRWNL